MTRSGLAWIVGALIVGLAGAAWGDYAYVGSGDNFAKVLVEFGDGAIYALGVSFADPSTTGIGLVDAIEAGTTLTTQREYYSSYGWIIEGISYKGHSSTDDWHENPNAWWRYWVNDPPSAWEMPWTMAPAPASPPMAARTPGSTDTAIRLACRATPMATWSSTVAICGCWGATGGLPARPGPTVILPATARSTAATWR